jgi:hypothetical protein
MPLLLHASVGIRSNSGFDLMFQLSVVDRPICLKHELEYRLGGAHSFKAAGVRGIALRQWNGWTPPLLSSQTTRQQQGIDPMKTSTTVVVALALGALAACNQSPQENTADQIEANAENAADVIEANTENVADTLEANADTAADATRAAGENAADQTRAAGENAADEARNGADADGNSAD